ncbi:MAG: hypothetical protein COU90_03985 [Candidatus Ryanbacteria bacterium CG10_big_fil_rev_8_21_14_0_10_43_42]|uniref:histidine kinase n=1 Tax=Candidatus Ryanbacteria bacterium CG10_big_fil_rev_8_21_14_0_10_43_42 TaxID=1974864 RepID=A0A2M8KWF1_9BACT|nr:MAG: hypothetical protein COU90_03985 [Candidatus Ryanbacteria bacterium CG10_big_fil_rev_8_21_14_0_10_43_42]
MESSEKNVTSVQKQYMEFDSRRVSVTNSLFFRIFISIFGLSIIPVIVSGILIAAAYQAILRDYVHGGILAIVEQNVRIQFLLILLFIVILVSFFSFILARSITRPIQLLISATRRITDGDMNIRIKLDRKDEIGKLATFFNIMVQRFVETQKRNTAISRIKSQFVSVTAHQLRTPLSALKWTIRMLLDGDIGTLQKRQKDLLMRGYDTNERMIRLVNDFLNVSRIEEGRYGFHFDKIQIRTSISEAIEGVSLDAARRHVAISTDLKIPEDLVIVADKERLHTVFTNVLDNAVRYSKENGSVIVSAFMRPDELLQVDITDTGIGIPAEERDRIFTRFYRASNATRHQTDGSGLGLFIVQNIVERHGGTVWFTSEEDKGTTISFTLPSDGRDLNEKKDSFKEFMDAV